jgi:type IV secretory pathway protease TraF
MWVVLPVPVAVQSRVRGYRTLLKQVAAVAGDWVCVVEATLWIITDRGTALEHSMNYGAVDHARHGLPVPHLEDGCFQVATQEVFLASPPAPALDSRHFNAVPVASLTARAFPFLTWR